MVHTPDEDRAARKLRVLTLIDHLHVGGAELLAARVAMGLDPTRFERWLCVTRGWGRSDIALELEAAGVRLFSLERSSRVQVWKWLRLLRELRRGQVDIVHTHKFGSNVWGTALARLAGVPAVVAHEHTWSFEGNPVRRFLDREVVARGADLFLAVSAEDRRRMIDVEGIRPDSIRLLPNGIPPMPPPSGNDVRAELGIRPDAPIVVSVSVIRPQKALDVLVRAAALLRDELPDLRVLVVGGGVPEEVTRIEALVAELALGETVRLLGRRGDVSDLLAAADVAVNCSDFEGTPLAVLEYMAAGKGIVATRVGGVPDAIEDGVHGLLVEPRDVPGLAAAIGRLLRDAALGKRLGGAARERQRTEFDLDVMLRRVEAIYEELFARTARARRERSLPTAA